MRGLVGWGIAAVVAGVLGGCDDDRRVTRAVGGLRADTGRLAFGETTLGVAVRRDLLLEQFGRLPAEVTRVSVVPDDGVFAVDVEPGRVVPVEGSHLVRVRYRPVRARRDLATLTLELMDGEPVRVTLDGTGVDARAVAEAVDFGRPAVGAVRLRTLRLHNDASTPVPLQLALGGPDAGELSLETVGMLAARSSVELALRWAPEGRAGPRSFHVALVACPLCAPGRIALRGEAVPTPLVVSPDPLHFGGVPIDGEKRVNVAITNATDEVIDLTAVGLDAGADPGFALDGPATAVLAPLATVSVAATLTPLHLGAARATLAIDSNAEPAGIVRIALDGSGGGPQLVVAPTRLEFRATPAGARAELVLQVANGGADEQQAPLTILGVDGPGGAFSLVQAVSPGTVLQAGEAMSVRIAFAPSAAGLLASAVVVRSDDVAVPAVSVPITGIAVEAAECRLSVTPAALAFGHLRVGKAATLVTRLENTGAEACTIWDAQVTGDPAFSLTRPRAFVQLAPGQGVPVPVTFRPTRDGLVEGALTLETNRPAEPTLVVPITGGSFASCLRPEPGIVDFGVRRLDCGTAELPVAWRNVCAYPLDITAFFAGPGPDETFTLASADTVPATLGAGDLLGGIVHFAPVHVGWTARPFFLRADGLALPQLAAVQGEVLEVADHEETFVQPVPNRVDVLFVVDNTASLEDERAGLRAHAGEFLAAAEARGIDYHLGVTTTGVGLPQGGATTTPCPGGADGNESGRLFPVDRSRPRILTPLVPDRVAAFAANLGVGGCHNVEQGLEAARRALTAPLVNHLDDATTAAPLDGNAGFVRPDASLAIVVVSDEDDESPGPLADRIRRLARVKPTSPLSLHALVAPPGGCATAVEPGTAWLAAVDAIGGTSASVCEPDWTATLGTLAEAIFSTTPRTRFPLAAAADPPSLVVELDGAPAPTWTYDPAGPAIELATAPPPGARLVVRYREPCP